TQVEAGQRHSLTLQSNGSVWAFGADDQGQLGQGSVDNQAHPNPALVPIPVAGVTPGSIGIAAGDNHNLALRADGTVWAWGNNSFGQLGDGTITPSRLAPVQTQGITNAIAISAGQNYSLAVRADGTLVSWGYNGDGQLGTGSLDDSNVPV